MRVEVGTIRWISRLGVVSAWIACGYEIIALGPGRASEATPICFIAHFSACYALTLLSFAAFASVRRLDLMKFGILAAASIEAARILTGAPFRLMNFTADLLGILAVFVPSYIDGFRVLTRVDAHEPFSTVYSNRRRRTAAKHEA